VQRKFAALAAFATLLAGGATGCGGSGHDEHARSLYDAYRTAEDARTDAEEELRLAFGDISLAASKLDRAGVTAAAQRGQDAVKKIDDLLAAEIEAADGLAGIESTAAHAQQLSKGLQLSRDSLALVAKELQIALDDPFLDTKKKELDHLAKESADLAVKGELEIRRADRALALALGLEPRLDQMFTTKTPTTTSPG
jgi:hypothetical protein